MPPPVITTDSSFGELRLRHAAAHCRATVEINRSGSGSRVILRPPRMIAKRATWHVTIIHTVDMA